MNQLTWQVLGPQITQSTELAPGGTGIADYYVVPFKITGGPAAGHMGTVKIPADQFSDDTVRAAVQLAADDVHAVAALTG
ncbi:MAG TPA: hypothetical protein VIX86_19225 [Streptosporangiaceae bacterium]